MTVQTVLRRFGSKEALLAAVAEWRSARMRAERDATEVGDLDGAIANLVEDYERWGNEVLHFLAQKGPDPGHPRGHPARARLPPRLGPPLFASQLRRLAPEQRERRIVQLIAATDLYTWKILRRDLDLGRDEVEEALRDLADRIVRGSPRARA